MNKLHAERTALMKIDHHHLKNGEGIRDQLHTKMSKFRKHVEHKFVDQLEQMTDHMMEELDSLIDICEYVKEKTDIVDETLDPIDELIHDIQSHLVK